MRAEGMRLAARAARTSFSHSTVRSMASRTTRAGLTASRMPLGLAAPPPATAPFLGQPARSRLFAARPRPNGTPFPPISPAMRHMSMRAISFRFIPRVAFRLVRLPAALGITGAGALTYASGKLDDARDKLAEYMLTAEGLAAQALGTVEEWSSEAQNKWAAWVDSLDFTAAQESRDELLSRATSLRERARDFFGSLSGGNSSSSSSNGSDSSSSSGPGGKGPAAALAASLVAKLDEQADGQAVDDEEEAFDSEDSAASLMHLTRQLIEVRNILKTIDHTGEEIALPSIVVIGSQSSGKSSVLEAVVGHEFLPKGSNMVTRRPIELTLIHTRPTGKKGDVVEFGEFPGTGLGPIRDFRQIQETLRDMNLAVPKEQAVSDVPIELHIHSPHVPDLSMIDLPGYVQVAGMDQPDELREKIEKLCEQYIAPSTNNVILAVCAADVDLANSPALRASRKVDPLGLRTIGVITKMDLIPPDAGASILYGNRYPLALGYVGVVAKNPKSSIQRKLSRSHLRSGASSLTGSVEQQEDDYFAQNAVAFQPPTKGRYAGVEPLLGTDALRRRLMTVLEESMGSSLQDVSTAVQMELEEAAYSFKVQYNDRSLSAEAYMAETIDALKHRLQLLADQLGKPQARALLKHALDEKVLDILAQLYWSDSRTPELGIAGEAKMLPPPKTVEDREKIDAALDRYWMYKLDASTSALTKAGIGRLSTQIVVDAIRNELERLLASEPFAHHQATAERVEALAAGILRERFALTADQVENAIKPLKYEVEIEQRDWDAGRVDASTLLQRELDMCTEAAKQLRSTIGKSRLNAAVSHVMELDERQRQRAAARWKAIRERSSNPESALPDEDVDANDPLRPDYNAALLGKAREAIFLDARADILKKRLKALTSKRCKSGPGPQSDAYCPETFLNVVAEKLTYTSVMFINIELLAEFFYQFPRELDTRLVQELNRGEVEVFARENPTVRDHLTLQERKQKLELVRDKLDSLLKLYQGKAAPLRPQPKSKWSFF